jgi:hypothetical protein
MLIARVVVAVLLAGMQAASWPAVTWAAAADRTAASPTAADDSRGVEARKACTAGQVEKGIQLLADYLSTSNDVTAIFNMGRCYQQNGVVDKALLAFREYLRKAPALPPEERREVDGYVRELEAQQRERPPVVEQPAPTRERRTALRTAGLVMGAAGVGSLGAGLLFAVRVHSANVDLHDRSRTPDPTSYTRRQRDGIRAETLQWIFIGVGAAGLAAGSACTLISWPAPREVMVAVPWAWSGGGGAAVAGHY